VDTIPEDVDVGKKDACIQATLCNCDVSGTKVVVETASKDACEQANLCRCSEFVGHAVGVSSAASQGSPLEDVLRSAHPLPNTPKNSYLYLQASSVKNISDVGAGDRPDRLPSSEKMDNCSANSATSTANPLLLQPSDANRSEVVRSSTSLFSDSYKKSSCNASLHNSVGDQLTDEVFKSESGGSQSDSVLVSVCDISLQTSVIENIGVRETPGDRVDVKQPVCNATSAANQLSSQPPDNSRDEMVRSTDILAESSKNGSRSMSCDNSVDSITVSMCNVSLHTSVVEKIRDVAVEHLEASAGGHLPSLDNTVLYSLSPSTYTTDVDRSSNNGCKKSDCSMSSDASVGDKLFDNVFESGYAAVRAATNVGSSEVLDLPKPLYPVLDDASDDEVAVQTRGMEANLISNESGGDIVCQESPNAPGGLSPAQKLVADVPKPPLPPILNDTTDREMDVHTHRNEADLPSDESDNEIICRESLNPQGDLSPAVQTLVSVGPRPSSPRVLDDAAEQQMDMHTHGNAADLLSNEADSEIICPESLNPQGDLSPASCKVMSDVAKPACRPVLDDATDQKMDVNTRAAEPDLLSEESDGEIFYRDSTSPQDRPSPAARKVLTSTTIDSPEAISNFFRLAGSSLSGSEKSPQYPADSEKSLTYLVENTRRKSKHGRRRVSMCGEYDGGSPTEYFTPHRMTAATKSVLTTVADTDEEDTVPSSKLFTTAAEGLVLDTASESDDDCKLESVKSAAAANGCIPDSPVEDGEPVENGWSFGESFSSQSSESSEHVSAEPTADGCSLDVQCESNKVVRRISAVDDGNSASPATGVEHLQTESAVLEASAASVQNTLREPANGTPSDKDGARNGAADNRNRYCGCYYYHYKRYTVNYSAKSYRKV